MDIPMRVILTGLILLSTVTLQVPAVQSDTCWDGVNGVDYTGTIAVTMNGHTCQSWADDSPHTHSYHGSAGIFPYDGDDVAASNYCRDPDGTSGSSGPWCYTMDPSTRFDDCVIPICYNLPCTGNSVAGQSVPSSFTASLDAHTSTNYLQKESSPYGFTCCGTVSQWRVYIQSAGTIRFQVWRLDTATGNYILRGENVYSYAAGDINVQHDETVLQSARITVNEGDLIGWYTSGTDMVSYSAGTTNQIALLGTSAPSIGDSVDFSGATIENSRDYAIGAEVTPSMAPYFDTTVTSINVLISEAIGNTVHTLTFTDDDTDDVSSLVVTMATNTYFNISGSDIVVKSNLVTGVETLQISVTDQCSQTGTITITVTVISAPVIITSLPTTVRVSETVTIETLLHTLTVTPADTYTCTLDSYSPTRAEGNPFIIKNNATSGDNGIYLKSAADIRYNVATSYNVSVTCTNTDPASGSSYIIIDIDPNTQPVFTNFQSSLSIDATTTNINDVVYTATVTDTDPVTLSLTTDPTPAPFSVSNNGEIRITSDPSSLTQTSYTMFLTADDTYNAVTSSNISVTIINLNDKPVITNLPTATQTVLENQSVGTLVYNVTQSDANGDTPTFSATYSSAGCAGMYTIDTSTGVVSTLASLDYETDTSCTLTISVSDGQVTSDPQTLVIDVGDADEPPVLSSSAYVVTTDEVTDGTVLSSAGISATDPEGTAVTYSLDCAYVDINPSTGVVTMTTGYDIDTSPTDPYTITCIVKATDATSQTATATLDVIVNDANDNPPVFAPAAYTFYINEGYTGFGIIGTVTATDVDKSSPNNAITYTISPTTSFGIDAATGTIQNTVDISGAGAGTTFTLTVTATDGGTPPQTDTAAVVVSILSTTVPTTATTPAVTSSGASSGAAASTTAGASAPTAAASSADNSSFFSNTGNIILMALAAFTALILAALFAFLIWMFCCRARFLSKKNHASRIGPGEKNLQDYPTYNRKVDSIGTMGPSDRAGFYLPTEGETPYSDRRQSSVSIQTPRGQGWSPRESPIGSEWAESGDGFRSVSSVPNRMSAVQSVRRTNWLTRDLESPRSVSKLVVNVTKNSKF